MLKQRWREISSHLEWLRLGTTWAKTLLEPRVVLSSGIDYELRLSDRAAYGPKVWDWNVKFEVIFDKISDKFKLFIKACHLLALILVLNFHWLIVECTLSFQEDSFH